MKIAHSLRNLPYAIAAAATVALLSDEAEAASGSSDVGAIADKVSGQIGNVGKLLVYGAFLAGVGLVISGLMKLKQAADTQGQQVKYGEGLWRLAVGAGLIAVPSLSGVLTQSAGLSAAEVTDSKGF